MGIRTLLVPFAYLAAFILKKLKVSIYAIVTFSFLLIFATIGAFYMIFEAPFNTDLYTAIVAAGIFLTGLMDEVIRELERTKKQPAFPLALVRHSDVLLVSGVLYISAVQPYGIIPVLTGVGVGVYATIGTLFLFGVLMVDFAAKRIEKRDKGIETRAERMFLLTGFILIGFYLDKFALSLFAGIIAVTSYLYVWVIWRNFDFYKAGEAIYFGISRAWRRISARGLPDIKKPKIPSGSDKETQEDFQEYGTEEYSSSGYSFTTVVNDRRSEPVSNVKITLNNLETGDIYTGYTDPSGRASFNGTSEGQYEITLECEGFKGTKYERYISMDSGEVFVLKRPFTDLSIVITDKIKTTPVPSARVIVKLPGAEGPELRKNADNLGVAYFDELDVGICEISVVAPGYNDWKREINLEEENVISVTLEKGRPKPEPAIPEAKPTEGELPEEKIEAKEEEPTEEEPETGGEKRKEASLKDTLSESALFEYYNVDDVRPLVSRMVEEYKSNDIDIYLVSIPERAEEYADLGVKIVDVPEEPDKFKEVLEGMPAGSVLIFEPLSNLIITGGFDAAYKFIKKTFGYMKSEGLTLVCFVNPRAHEGKEVERLRKILKSVTIDEDKIYKQ
jgi:hypothetical protein